jgi:hypothetical protein
VALHRLPVSFLELVVIHPNSFFDRDEGFDIFDALPQWHK